MIKDIEDKVNEIFDTDFKSSLRGYKKSEIDIFLDMIADFMESIIHNIKIFETENDDILKENLFLKSQIIKLEKKIKEQKKEKELDEILLEKKLDKMTSEIKTIKSQNL